MKAMVVTQGHLSLSRETPVSLLIVLLALLPSVRFISDI